MKKLLCVLGVMVISAALLVWWLFSTQSGLQFAVQTAEKVSDGRLQIQDVSGRLGSTIILRGVKYTSEGVDVQLDTVDFAWRPLEMVRKVLHVRHFRLEGIRIATAAPEHADSTSEFSLPRIGLPFDIVVDTIEVTSVRLESEDSMVTSVDRLEMRIALNQERLELDRLLLRSDLADLQLSGSAGIPSGQPILFSGSWTLRPPEIPEIEGGVHVSGTLADGQVAVETHAPFTAIMDTGFHLGETFTFSSLLQAKEFDPSPFIPQLSASLDIAAEVSGVVDNKGVQAEIDLQNISGNVNGIDMEIRGGGRFVPNSLVVDTLHLKHNSAELTLKGKIGDRVEASFEAVSPDISVFLAGAAGNAEISGTVTGELGNPGLHVNLQAASISYNDVEIDEVLVEADTEAVKDGRVSFDAVFSNARLQGQVVDRVAAIGSGTLTNHQFEIDVTHPEVTLFLASKGGFADRAWKGSIDRMRLEPKSMNMLILDGASDIKASTEEVQVEPLCLRQSDARVCIEGMLRDKNWQARVELNNFNPELFATEYPGQVHAILAGHGSLAGESPRSTVEVSDLSGEVRNMPIEGGARAEIQGSAIALKRFDLQYGNASMKADGTVNDSQYDFEFSTTVPDIGSFLPGWSGAVMGRGTLAGSRKTPTIVAEFTANDISGEAFSLERGIADIDMDLEQRGILSADISVFGLQGVGRTLSEGRVELTGTTASHTLEADLRSDIGKLVLRARGGYDGGWAGILETMQLDALKYGNWSLREESNITIGLASGKIDHFCPTGQKAQFCFAATYDEQKRWSLETDVDSFNLSLLNDTGMIGVALNGVVEGQLSMQGDSSSLKEISGSLRSGEIELAEAGDDDRLEYLFVDNRLDLDMQGTRLEMELHSSFGSDGDVRADIILDDATSGTKDIVDIPLKGSINFDLADLNFITILTNFHVQPTGKLHGSLKFDGRLGKPETEGKVYLEDGSIFISSVGITLEEVSADIENRGGILDYVLTAKSGNGTARGEGSLQFGTEGNWTLASHLVGKDFRLMATDQYVIDVTPDIDLQLGDGENYLRGRFSVPHARITLKSKESRVTPSDDVVIVDRGNDESRQKNGLSINLEVMLGEDVSIDAYGLKSRLAGSLAIESSPGRLLTGFGELTVEDGQFVFYSAELEVTRGRLLFSGGGIENPGVDFRAQRKVEDRLVGAEVGGTAEDLEISLFSDPAMDESNILAYMLVGRSLYASSENQQSLIGSAATAIGLRGVNTITNSLQQYLPVDEIYLDGSTANEDFSLVMGKHITDDLFIGYDHNFFDSSGEFKIRYNLGRSFSVETRTSVDSTSGDILYTIEQ